MAFVSNAGKATAEQTSFDNTTNGFISTNVQKAIEEVKNDITGGSIGSIYYVGPTEVITIPIGRENLVTNPQIIDGTLIVDGRNTVL